MQQQYVFIASLQDLAGRTMVNSLQDEFGFKLVNGSSHEYQSSAFENILLHVSPDDLLHQEKLDDAYPMAIAFIFLSKHKSDSKIPTLTCHCTGNFGSNPFGGNARELAISFPSLQKSYLKRLVNSRDHVPEYEIVIEATHHGPTSLRKPVLFVELGSSEKQWEDANAASVICSVVLDLVRLGPDRCAKVGIGLGGTHYPSKFNRLLLESEFGLAAVASKHNLESIDEPMLSQMISKSIEKVTTIVLDGKGLGPHKDRIMNMAEKTGLEILNLK
ncbi:MAG TPA: D-aminoacyl-tRNA deacylase [Nitrososphaera sp.]|nr:D-aminoacyl-tRNA deacylase [Nitrososphaera sp.]